jgi:hypothetical protein
MVRETIAGVEPLVGETTVMDGLATLLLSAG